MAPPDKSAYKQAKKELKAAQKAAKKGQSVPSAPTPSSADPDSPAERAARAAERKVMLEHWRIWLAVAGLLVAVLTLLFTLLRRG
ncbi:MAG: hypothetical protein PVJ57_00155 [Phycisphaerae bacterium]|jgi:hypothetical protein